MSAWIGLAARDWFLQVDSLVQTAMVLLVMFHNKDREIYLIFIWSPLFLGHKISYVAVEDGLALTSQVSYAVTSYWVWTLFPPCQGWHSVQYNHYQECLYTPLTCTTVLFGPSALATLLGTLPFIFPTSLEFV